MDRFYLEKLVVSGGSHKASVIKFGPGINFILGPSNTGKTMVMECIDYALGFQPRKDRPSKIVENSNGYERVTLHLRTAGGTVILERKIGTPHVMVSGTDPSVDHGKYSVGHKAKKNTNALFLHLIGIDEVHNIRSAQKNDKTCELTWRGMIHLFLLKQGDVARESSALYSPVLSASTASAATLLFLLTGKDANDLEKKEDPKISEAKRKALVTNIQDKVDRLAERREKLEQMIQVAGGVDISSGINAIRTEISSIQEQISSATSQSRELMSSIYDWNGKLSECRTMSHNFDVLRQQYQSDIKRIGFIVDGAIIMGPGKKKVKCPICGEETERIQDTAFIGASASELEKIKRHIAELGDAQSTLDKRESEIEAIVSDLERKKAEVDRLITDELQPRLSAFQTQLENQLQLSRVAGELKAIRETENLYRAELEAKETEEVPKDVTHNILADYAYDVVQGYEEKLRAILTASKIGGAATARLNMETFDVQIGGKKKSVANGGGFCGILNTITTVAMAEYLLELDRIAPRFYAVDSALTQLSEASHVSQSSTIKQNFIEYLIANAGIHQVIFVEQAERMPFMPVENEDAGIHVELFSKNVKAGRYGFLNDVYDPVDEVLSQPEEMGGEDEDKLQSAVEDAD